MEYKSQVKTVVLQVILPVAIFVVAGLLAPMYAAPYIYSWLPIDPYSSSRSSISLAIKNRNLVSGEIFRVRASRSSGVVNITKLEYSCQRDGLRISYQSDDRSKQLPCGVTIRLPDRQQHSFQVQSGQDRSQYIPVTVTVQSRSAATTTTFSILIKDQQDEKRYQLSDEKIKSLDL